MHLMYWKDSFKLQMMKEFMSSLLECDLEVVMLEDGDSVVKWNDL